MFERIKNFLFHNEIMYRLNFLNHKVDIIMEMIDNAKIDYEKAKAIAIEAQNHAIRSQEIAKDAQELVNSIIDVGVDVGFKDEHHSWAVVCIEGKPEYVKFLQLQHADTREIMHFLKKFQGSSRVVDSPFGFPELVGDRYMKGGF